MGLFSDDDNDGHRSDDILGHIVGLAGAIVGGAAGAEVGGPAGAAIGGGVGAMGGEQLGNYVGDKAIELDEWLFGQDDE